MFWNIAIPVIALVVGLIGGFFIGVIYLRKQITKMQNDPEAMRKQLDNMDPQMMQKMARQMGVNLDHKQMQKAQKMMKNGKFPR